MHRVATSLSNIIICITSKFCLVLFCSNWNQNALLIKSSAQLEFLVLVKDVPRSHLKDSEFQWRHKDGSRRDEKYKYQREVVRCYDDDVDIMIMIDGTIGRVWWWLGLVWNINIHWCAVQWSTERTVRNNCVHFLFGTNIHSRFDLVECWTYKTKIRSRWNLCKAIFILARRQARLLVMIMVKGVQQLGRDIVVATMITTKKSSRYLHDTVQLVVF